MDNFDLLATGPYLKILLSVALIAGMIGIRALLIRTVLRRVMRAEERRRWIVHVRNILGLATVLGLVGIWADVLRGLALSLLALGVAFVIATKELIQSILGSLVRAATGSFSVGDRIEIGNHRGDVIDQNLITTTILEVGPGRAFHLRTGRLITFANNKILDSFVINESYTKQYVVHAFSIPFKLGDDWEKAESILLAVAADECAPYLEDARATMKSVEMNHGLQGLPVQPRTSLQIPEAGKLNLLVRVPAPVGQQGRVEQAILRRFLREFSPQMKPTDSDSGEESSAGHSDQA